MSCSCNMHVTCMKNVQNPCMLNETCTYINIATCMFQSSCKSMKFSCYIHQILSSVLILLDLLYACLLNTGSTECVCLVAGPLTGGQLGCFGLGPTLFGGPRARQGDPELYYLHWTTHTIKMLIFSVDLKTQETSVIFYPALASKLNP